MYIAFHNFVLFLIVLLDRPVPFEHCLGGNHYCGNYKAEEAQGTGYSEKSSLAEQARFYILTSAQIDTTPADLRRTPQRGPQIQSSSGPSLQSQQNGYETNEERKTSRVEMWNLSKDQQGIGPMVPMVLGTLVRNNRFHLQTTNEAEYSEKTLGAINANLRMEDASYPELAGRRLVAKGQQTSIQKHIQKGSQSQKETGETTGRADTELAVCNFFGFTIWQPPFLCSDCSNHAMAPSQGEYGKGAHRGSTTSHCGMGESSKRKLPGSQGHSKEDERHDLQVRDNFDQVCSSLYGANRHNIGRYANQTQGDEAGQGESSSSLAQEPQRDHGYLGRTLQVLYGTTRRVLQAHCDSYDRNGDDETLIRRPVQESGRDTSQDRSHRRCNGRTESRARRKGSSEEVDVSDEDMHGISYGSHASGQQRGRRGREQRRQRWRWSTTCQAWAWSVLNLGCSQPCLRKDCYEPLRIPKTVHFDIAVGTAHESTWDGPDHEIAADRPHHGFHSFLLEDDCLYPFGATTTANNLALEIFFEDTSDLLATFRSRPPYFCTSMQAPGNSAFQSSLHRNEEVDPTCNAEPGFPRHQISYEIDFPGLPLEGRPFIDHMPPWVQQLQQGVFYEQAEIDRTEDGPSICLLTWYLHGDRHRTCPIPRAICLDLYYEYWEDTIRRTWNDIVDADEDIDVHLVYPEPPRSTGRMHSGHLLVVQNQGQHDRAIVLSSFFRDAHESLLWQRAMLTHRAITAADVHRLSDQQQLCRRFGCTVFHDEVILDDNFHWLNDGSSIVQYTEANAGRPHRTWEGQPDLEDDVASDASSLLQDSPDPMQRFLDQSTKIITDFRHTFNALKESDDFSLMGRNPILARPNDDNAVAQAHEVADDEANDDAHLRPGRWYSAIIFQLQTEPTIGRIASGSLEQFIAQVAQYLHISQGQLTELHEIKQAPQDLAPVFDYILAAHKRDDVPEGSRGRLVLTDIEFCNNLPDLDVDIARSLKLIVSPTTRTTLLRLTGLAQYCQKGPCLMKLNGNFVHEIGPFNLQHGDFLHITVGPINDEQCTDTRLMAAALNQGIDLIETPHEVDRINVRNFPPRDSHFDRLPPYPEPHLQLMQHDVKLITCRNDGEMQETLQTMQDISDNNANRDTERIVMDALEAERPVIRDLHGHWLRVATPGDEQPWTPVQVWYISHARFRICPTPRTVWLTADFTLWYRNIIDSWQDQIDPLDSVTLLIITPQPEREEGQTILHVLLVQHDVLPDEGACLVTLQDNGYRDGQLEHQALVLPLRVTHEVLLTVANRLNFCLQAPSTIRCFSRFGLFDITNEPMRARAGLAFHVEIRRGDSGPTLFPTMIPAGMPQMVRDLHAAIQYRQQNAPGEVVNLRVVTWFLNHRDHAVCTYGRDVDLPPDPHLWIVVMLQHWPDVWKIDFPIDAFLATPTPQHSQWSMGTQFHVILHQEPIEGCASTLVTMFDTTHGTADPSGLHRAVVLPKQVHRNDVLERVELLDWCREPTANRGCQVHYSAVALRDDTSFTCDNGFAFRIVISNNALPQWEAQAEEQDEHTLLQLHRHLFHEIVSDPKPDIAFDFTAVWQDTYALDERFMVPRFDIYDLHAWHPASLEWIQLPWWEPLADNVHSLYIYYDGSFTKTGDDIQAGAALVAFVLTSEGWKLAGLVSTNLADATTSYQTEVWASILSTKVALDIVNMIEGQQLDVPDIVFGYDSLSVGRQAEGDWQFRTNPADGKILRSLRHMLDIRSRSKTSSWHIPSHRGDPGNEIVDVASREASKGHATHDTTDLRNLLRAAVQRGTIDWLWTTAHEGMPFNDQGHLSIPASPLTEPSTQIFQDLPKTQTIQAQPHPIRARITLATCNVLSLCAGRTDEQALGLVGPARQEYLLKQLHERKVHIWAFQETRLRRQHGLIDENYYIYHAAASSKGHFGIMIGISKKLAYADGSYFHDTDIGLVEAAPRFLILRLSTPGLKCIIVAAHAPHRGSHESEIAVWWENLAKAIPNKFDSWPRILLADANAHVGAEPCDQIGDHQCQDMDEKDAHFSEFIREQGLWLPSTFVNIQSGDGDTWTHSGGKTHRLDYVALPTAWSPITATAWVPADFEVAIQKEDHKPAMVTLEFDYTITDGKSTSKTNKINLANDTYIWDLHATTQIPWTTDVHTHAALLQTHIYDTVCPYRVPTVKKQIKPTMTTATWDLVCQKRDARQHLHELRQQQRKIYLTLYFRTWQGAVSSQQLTDFDRMIADMDHLVAHTWLDFRRLGRQALRAVRQDDRRFYESLLEGEDDLAQPHQTKQLWKFVRRALPKFRQRRMQVHPSKLVNLEDEWIPHLAELEHGKITSPDELIANLKSRRTPGAQNPVVTERSIHHLPTLLEFEEALRETKAGRSTGLDPFESGFYKQHAAVLARLHYPLLLKMWSWQTEPLPWKGGLVHMIPKKPGPTQASHYRGIALLKAIPKRVHAMLRSRIIRAISDARPEGQIGGFPAQQCPFGSQALRIFNRVAAEHHITSCVLFVDLRQAFHRLVRETVLGVPDAQAFQYVQQELAKTGIDVSSLREWEHSRGILHSLGAPPELIAMLQDVHCETWTSHNGIDLLHTQRGTRPGSPLADVIFHIVMIRIVSQIDAWLIEEPLIQRALQVLGLSMQSVVWSDDLAVPVCTVQACDLIPLLQRLTTFVHHLFEQFGFELNMDKGKTSAVVAFRGNGAPALRREYLLGQNPHIVCDVANGERLQLHLVHSYKHLGAIYAANGQLDLEVRMRLGQAKAAFQQLARPLLCNRRQPLHLRVRLFKALVQSKMDFGLGAWSSLTTRHYQSFKGAMISMMRRMLGFHKETQNHFHSYDELLRLTGLEDIRQRQASQRLLYAQKFFRHAPHFMQLNAHQEHSSTADSWLHGVFQDIGWIHAVYPSRVPNHWCQDLTEVIEMWQQPGPSWTKLIKSVNRLHTSQESMMVEIHDTHSRLIAMLKDGGALFDGDRGGTMTLENVHACVCGSRFATHRGLLAHQRKVHSWFSPERQYLSGSTCPVCLKFLWSTQRLQQHLSYMPRDGTVNRCFQMLQMTTLSLPYECHRLPNTGLNRHDVLQIHGPGIALPDRFWFLRKRYEDELSDLQAELDAIPAPDDPARQGEQLGDILARVTWQWLRKHEDADTPQRSQLAVELGDCWLGILTRFPETFQEWTAYVFVHWGRTWLGDIVEQVVHGELEFVLVKAFEILEKDLPCTSILDRRTYLQRQLRNHAQRELPGPHRPVQRVQPLPGHNSASGGVRRLFDEQENWQTEIRTCKLVQLPPDQKVPCWRDPDGGHRYFIVHLFSGHRREHDVHHWVQHYAENYHMKITVLSMDTAVSPYYGNLHPASDSWANLRTLYQAQRVAATIAGTPCETWSAARHRAPPPEAKQNWPRPLRSASAPFGLPELKIKEMTQLYLGSAFFLQGLETLILHILYGGLFLSEHPAIPSNPDYASIWRTALLQVLLAGHPDLTLHHIAQWQWGAKSIKPTGLLAFNIPHFLRDLYACTLEGVVRPTHEAIGVNDAGDFNTAELKAYPPALCHGIGFAIMRALHARHRSHDFRSVMSDLSPDLQQWLRDAVAVSEQIRKDATYLPDYQG